MKNIIIVLLVLFVGILAIAYFNKDRFSFNQTNNSTTSTGKKVDLSNKGLTTLSTDMEKYSKIEEFDISNNMLTGSLPSEIGKLSNLKILNASNNKFTGIPAELRQLTKLESIDFSKNQITGLPMELGQLSKLKTLDLRGNNVSSVDLEALKKALPNTNILID